MFHEFLFTISVSKLKAINNNNSIRSHCTFSAQSSSHCPLYVQLEGWAALPWLMFGITILFTSMLPFSASEEHARHAKLLPSSIEPASTVFVSDRYLISHSPLSIYCSIKLYWKYFRKQRLTKEENETRKRQNMVALSSIHQLHHG